MQSRREAVLTIAALATWSAAAFAQGRIPVLALFWIESAKPSAHLPPLLQGLREHGYVPGKNIRVDDRFLVSSYEELAEGAARLVALNPDLVLVYGGTAVQALYRTKTSIPVVIAGSGDPVKLGVARSLSHPGGNFTGLTIFSQELSGKRLELLKDAFPAIRRVAVPFSPLSASEMVAVSNLEAAGREKNVEIQKLEVGNASEIRSAMSGIRKGSSDAIVFVPSTLFRANAPEVAAMAARTGLPACYGDEQYVEAGGLMSYGPSIAENFRKSGAYIDKVLKGAKPGDLAIEQPSLLRLTINLKTARTQRIEIPQSILLRADRLIE